MSSIDLNFYAHSLQFRTEVRVVLPEYPLQRDRRVPRREAFNASHKFPVVYLLHGFTGDYTDWKNMIPVERFAAESGFAVVMPHGYNTWYLNVPGGLQMEDFIADELPAAMEAMLPISGDPSKRFIAGLSMGGCGAIRIAWKHPENYRAVAAMSALPDLELPLCESINPAYDQILRSSILLAHGGPGGMQDPEKNILRIGEEKMKAQKKLPPLLFAYGEQDVRFEMQYPSFKAYCEKLDIPAQFVSGPGGHDFGFWEPELREILKWFREKL